MVTPNRVHFAGFRFKAQCFVDTVPEQPAKGEATAKFLNCSFSVAGQETRLELSQWPGEADVFQVDGEELSSSCFEIKGSDIYLYDHPGGDTTKSATCANNRLVDRLEPVNKKAFQKMVVDAKRTELRFNYPFAVMIEKREAGVVDMFRKLNPHTYAFVKIWADATGVAPEYILATMFVETKTDMFAYNPETRNCTTAGFPGKTDACKAKLRPMRVGSFGVMQLQKEFGDKGEGRVYKAITSDGEFQATWSWYRGAEQYPLRGTDPFFEVGVAAIIAKRASMRDNIPLSPESPTGARKSTLALRSCHNMTWKGSRRMIDWLVEGKSRPTFFRGGIAKAYASFADLVGKIRQEMNIAEAKMLRASR